jgi:hypothetical protein
LCASFSKELKGQLGVRRFDEAGRIFAQVATSADFPEFLTLIVYDYID